ncbi:MAG: M15 family metallopeptidase [bacterium]|nr:M15 family metallopeptidase [bacterium]
MYRLIFPLLISLSLAVLPVCGPGSEPLETPDSNLDYYGSTPPVNYLLGDFSPASHPLFVRLDRVNIPTGGRTIYLRKETADALGRMYAAFQKDHPDVEFWITSGTRNFRAQRGIWEAKWNGSRKVGGQKLNETIADPEQRALKILEYSSMPGTSRHHWGTDFDVNKLTNGYYKSGPGKILYDWMVANGGRYGFCQPYTAGRTSGYFEERWHWTYLPLARRFTKDWQRMVADRYPAGKNFAGSKGAGDLAPIYVESINPACQ